MKKLFAFLLALTLILALSACNNKGETGGEVKNDTASPSTNQNSQPETNNPPEQNDVTPTVPETSTSTQKDTAPTVSEAPTSTSNDAPPATLVTPPVQDDVVTETPAVQTEPTLISRERAIEIALSHAGLSSADIRDLDAELDRERNGVFWEVDFDSAEYDYSYDINAETGEIVKSEKERD